MSNTMIRITDLLAPPLATYRRGAAAACTGPVAVFWLTALVAIIYGLLGGPLREDGVNWLLVFLGLLMWGAAAVWAELATRAGAEDARGATGSTIRSRVKPERYQEDPFDEIK